ncbi:MAG TPA: CDP-glycerol glycerophosphotransferase family protein, partial [Isoptericola sp.]|nr:CDP-glycerol glycerophosphotransferase family protein [Isoptericola sp.]
DLLATTEEPSPVALLEHDDFRRADRRLAKDAALWVFSVDPVSGAFTGSGRSVFEAVRDEPSIRKAVLSRGEPLDVDGVNVEVVDVESPEGQARVLRAGTILVGRTLAAEVPYPVSGEFHNLVHLGAGEPHRLMAIAEDAARAEGNDDAQYRAIVGSSKVEVLALTAASYPLTFHQVWNTGLPRADFIGCDEDRLPADMLAELVRLRERVGDRRLLLWTAGEALALTPDDASWLSRWLVENDGVLGVRGSETTTWTSSLDGGTMIHLPEADFVHREVLLREAAALVTDFSSAFVDYLVTGRPMVGVAPPRDAAQGADRDMEAAFPGAVVRTPEALRSALDGIFGLEPDSAYEFKQRLFHDHFDGMNALRVAERVRDLTEVYGVGKRLGERMA